MRSFLVTLAALMPLTANAETALFLSIPSVSNSAQAAWDSKAAPILSQSGCRLHRAGKFGGSQGPLDWPDHNSFRLYKCDKSVIGDLNAANVMEDLSTFRREPVLVEGKLVEFEAPRPTNAAEYVIKVSYFNGLDEERRNSDLARFGEIGTKHADSWHTESVLLPSKTTGALRPDDLTFLFYESSEIAAKFRNDHPEVLELVGKFNAEHVSSFIYLGASLNDG